MGLNGFDHWEKRHEQQTTSKCIDTRSGKHRVVTAFAFALSPARADDAEKFSQGE